MVAAAVIIHLAADGTGYLDQTQCNITVQLVDTKEGIHSLGENCLLYSQYDCWAQRSCTADAHVSIRKRYHSFNTSIRDSPDSLFFSANLLFGFGPWPPIPLILWFCLLLPTPKFQPTLFLLLSSWYLLHRWVASQLSHQPVGDPSEPWPVGGLLPHQGYPGHVRLSPGGHLRSRPALLPVLRPHHDKWLPEQRDLQPYRPEVRQRKGKLKTGEHEAYICYTHIRTKDMHMKT